MKAKKILKEKRILLLFVLVSMVFASVMFAFAPRALSRKVKFFDKSGQASIGTDKEGARRNFLLLGRDNSSGLTDVIMLLSLDGANNCLNILQIPRDTYAEYVERGYRKINGAYNSLGGAEAVCSFLSNAFAMDIEGYAVFDLNSFAKAVDMIGGVEVDIPFAMEYRDPYQDLHISIPSGRQMLDGKLAEQFVRYRFGYVRGDLGRIDAQKLFMSALFEKLSHGISKATLLRVATSLVDEIDTNVGITDAISLATSVISLSAERINMLTLSGEDVRSETSGAWFFVISKSAAFEQLSEYMGAEADTLGFDSRGAFLNEASEKFAQIYNAYIPYSVSNASEINQNGITIEKN